MYPMRVYWRSGIISKMTILLGTPMPRLVSVILIVPGKKGVKYYNSTCGII